MLCSESHVQCWRRTGERATEAETAWTINMSNDNSINYETKMTKLFMLVRNGTALARCRHFLSSSNDDVGGGSCSSDGTHVTRPRRLNERHCCSQERGNDISANHNLRNNNQLHTNTQIVYAHGRNNNSEKRKEKRKTASAPRALLLCAPISCH